MSTFLWLGIFFIKKPRHNVRGFKRGITPLIQKDGDAYVGIILIFQI
jgi:hypothetical protein